MSDDDRWDDDAMRWTPDDERQSGRGLTVGTVIFDEVDNWGIMQVRRRRSGCPDDRHTREQD